ncbi:MAG: right-handed parallel beta-helix repeat-containing protein [Spirochaetaceae bacterium]|jgi:hypothetical protein|nr:right-handed parallel beta-helix repeat-containing protein [Spirochaetaceae bacterium]
MKRKNYLGLAAVLIAAFCLIISCQFFGGIGNKPVLIGSISIFPYTNVIPGKIVQADISGIQYLINPDNYQWYYAEDLAGIETGNYKAIEGATDIVFQIPAKGDVDYSGKFLFVEATDPDFIGSIKSSWVAVLPPPVPEPGYISGLVYLTESEGAFVANTSEVIYGEIENPDELSPSFTWYMASDLDNQAGEAFTKIEGATGDTLLLSDAYLDCNIRVEVTASLLKGAVYATKLYTRIPDKYISGEVFFVVSGNSIVADTRGVIYGRRGENTGGFVPSFLWYVDNKGDRNFNLIPGKTGKEIPWDPSYSGSTIRVEVKESSSTLKGSVYAEGTFWAVSEGRVYLMNKGKNLEIGKFDSLDACLTKLDSLLGAGQIYNYYILVLGTVEQAPVTLDATNNKYPNITNDNLPAFGLYSDGLVITGSGRLKLNAKGSLLKLNTPGLSLTLDGNLTLEGLTKERVIDEGGGGYNKIINAGLADDPFDNDSPLIYAGPLTSLTMKDGVTLCGNSTINGEGEPLFGAGSALALMGTYFDDNTDTDDGAVFTMEGGLIAWNYSGSSGTILISSPEFRLNDTDEKRDTPAPKTSGKFFLKGGAIRDNYVNNIGGGIYADKGTSIEMTGGKISDNEAQGKDGGGVAVHQGTFKMSGDAEISGNAATGGNGYAGGIHLTYSRFEMTGGIITNNTAVMGGGGVGIYATEFTMSGDSEITNNTAGFGGGVWSSGHYGYESIVNISGNAKINGNTTAGEWTGGGGMYIEFSELTIEGSAKIFSNEASMGGGIINLGSLNMSGGSIYNNTDSTNAQNQIDNWGTAQWPAGTSGYYYTTEGAAATGPLSGDIPSAAYTAYKIEAIQP